MTNEEKILATLEDIKQALKVIYGEGEEQEDMINRLGRTFTRNLGHEVSKLSTTLEKLDKIFHAIEDIQYKLKELPKLQDNIHRLTTLITKIDLNNLERSIDRIEQTLISFDGKLTSIYRKS